MDALVELLQQEARLTTSEIADRLGRSEAEVKEMMGKLETDGTVLGYHAVIDNETLEETPVSALIEVKLTPERDGGFDKMARRIAKFSQVTNCYLMSGGYDLAVIVEGPDLRDVARFVSEKLSTLDGVISTATHFQLKVYKQNGFLAKDSREDERLPVTP
ncbi:MAG: Lrp/AsnC family transcriptional regulator [Verrucomicrobiales bacterium]|jgi:DNA-binding Lrp family transcriptional regulator|nr:Lrp/AsnC family transcriptional regulator [Verrucomicrobiales bacterium]